MIFSSRCFLQKKNKWVLLYYYENWNLRLTCFCSFFGGKVYLKKSFRLFLTFNMPRGTSYFFQTINNLYQSKLQSPHQKYLCKKYQDLPDWKRCSNWFDGVQSQLLDFPLFQSNWSGITLFPRPKTYDWIQLDLDFLLKCWNKNPICHQASEIDLNWIG